MLRYAGLSRAVKLSLLFSHLTAIMVALLQFGGTREHRNLHDPLSAAINRWTKPKTLISATKIAV